MSKQDRLRTRRALASSVSGTTLLIMIQLVSRLFTFVANQLVLRNLSPATLGAATQLELFMVTILYFSREAIRLAIQRQPLDSASFPDISKQEKSRIACDKEMEAQSMATQSIVNMSYLSLGIGIALSILLGTSYIQFAAEQVAQTSFYRGSVAIVCLASTLELCTEPFFAVVHRYMLYKTRATVEMAAAFVKSLTTCGLFTWASWNGNNVGILPFALGHLSYALVLLCGYSAALSNAASRWHFSFLLSRIRTRDKSVYVMGMFSSQLISLSANLFFQSVVKHLLTQGDAMMLAAMASLEDQGIYFLASNYGGLIARVLFQPIEESSRTLFSSLLGLSDLNGEKSSNIEAAKTHLTDVMKAYGILSALIFPLNPVIIKQMLHLLGGTGWAGFEVYRLLSLYCSYIPFLAFNGITEAFVSSAANGSELRSQAGWMGVFSACFALAAYLFLRVGDLGARGLVYANIVNMTVRILWSLNFIREYMHNHDNDITLTEFGLSPHTYIAGFLMTTITILGPELFHSDSHGLIQAAGFCASYAILV
ncbi:putative nuclear division Rft1 protein [Aspergillus novofumigatus IBT 16806]|uniref:Man(5)GlcNAc(2)-PP-dolichol translocation protein RFT1 n=1 Tax=Aspergillus novofumigatus (strain IBT 16806) TaxID=1392255 RepID=A0A2I1CLR6_ASPN1|nr:putative nuclear division Rft1 protein [Aspergillus novofumigatus IBT 16806]PKX98562.1 putative nuclear division Rft1 protein [Aspergillus novofumigatus IBT 16806]